MQKNRVLLKLFAFSAIALMAFHANARSLPTGNFDFKIQIALTDTANVSAIDVQLGSSDGASNLLSYSFGFDIKTGLPNGAIYSRKKKNVELTLGSYPVGVAMYGVYKIKDKSGNVVLTKKFLYK